MESLAFLPGGEDQDLPERGSLHAEDGGAGQQQEAYVEADYLSQVW